MALLLEIGLAPFTSYLNATGAGKARVVAEHVERENSLDPMNYWCYSPALDGLRGALTSPNPDEAIQRMLERTPPRMEAHYALFAQGITELIASRHRYSLVPTGHGSWEAEGLHVDMKTCLGLRRRDGNTFCVLPYFNKESLTPDTAAGPVRLIELALPDMLPGAHPAVLDVRTSRLHRLHPKRNVARLDAWLQVEAGAYVAFRGRSNPAA